MAALCPGVQYGLSSQESFGENKEFIFVKLTDSALRTIEEYLRSQNKFNKSPTIQFLGNEGHLSFPAQNGSTTFNFSVSNTADMEGPGGSFECLQQPPRGSLGVLGPITHKIRVAANDDVYEATRHRMSVLEENAKNKSTREIEMNRTDIGRKVKVKQVPGRGSGGGGGGGAVLPMRRETPPANSRESSGSGGGGNSSIAKPTYPPSQPSNNKPVLHNSNNGLSNGLGSNHVSSSKPPSNKPSYPDIARRPIKERMIHMLALRPYKKPELYDRLTKEGLREKKAMTAVLKQIATLKDNCYHLNRAMYNEVHEDWQFYTESERQILKRRKPENLTPPGSSDGGSSGSGHSPTSTHPGSPPPVSSSSAKRPGYFDSADGVLSKRQRISHYRKPSEQTYRSPVENNSQRRPMTDSRDASNMNPRSRESPTPPPPLPPSSSASSSANNNNGYHHHASPSINGNGAAATTTTTTNIASSMLNDKRTISDDEDHSSNHATSNNNNNSTSSSSSNRKRAANCDSHSSSISSYDKTPPSSMVNGNGGGGGSGGGGGGRHPVMLSDIAQRDSDVSMTTTTMNGGGNAGGTRYKVSSSTQNSSSNLTSSGSNSRIARVSPDSQSDRCIALANVDSAGSKTKFRNKDDKTAGYPDYLHKYTIIRDKDQRKRYKADFNANYAEYRKLHGAVEQVSQRFADLKERLKNEDSSTIRYKDIKKQIVREYELSKKDCEHQKAKQRFQYLHDKLSHIKRLVSEYDQIMADSRY